MPTSGPDPNDDWLRRVSQAMTSMSRRTRSASLYDQVAARAGVTVRGPLLGLLFRIRELQPVRISDVAEHMGYERSTISRQVTELVDLKLVERERDATDARATLLRLTPKGRSTATRVERTWLSVLGEVTDGWSDSDRRRFLALLTELDQAIGQRLA